MSIEYKIGDVGSQLGFEGQKFIVSREGNSLIYHARAITPNLRYHQTIAVLLRLNLSKIVGGGSVEKVSSKTIKLYDCSEKFGGVPAKIMNGFESHLIEAYKKIVPNLSRLKIRTCTDPYNSESIESWLKRYNLTIQ